jgi:formate transporter
MESGPDVHPPETIARTTKRKGAGKATLETPQLLVLGLLAGVYIAFGSLFSTVALAGTQDALPHGPAQVLAGVAFSLGLILVLVGGAELFTGNTLMVVAWAKGRAEVLQVVRALGLAYVTNFVGSIAIVVMAVVATVHTAGEGAVGAVALRTADMKAGLGFGAALVSGIGANMLVCLAVWLAYGARSAADKVLVIVPPIAAFVALGLEHSVANMSLIPLGWAVKEFAGAAFWAESGLEPGMFAALTLGGFAQNLAASTIGNVIGGVLVGGAYWFAYLRPGSGNGG